MARSKLLAAAFCAALLCSANLPGSLAAWTAGLRQQAHTTGSEHHVLPNFKRAATDNPVLQALRAAARQEGVWLPVAVCQGFGLTQLQGRPQTSPQRH